MTATSTLEAELSSRTKEASKRRLSCGSERGAVSCCKNNTGFCLQGTFFFSFCFLSADLFLGEGEMPRLLDRPILVRPVVADRSVTADREGMRTLRRAAAAVAVICAVVAVAMLVSDENHSESLTQSMTKDDVEQMFKDTDEFEDYPEWSKTVDQLNQQVWMLRR
jgi:hypothetical protein